MHVADNKVLPNIGKLVNNIYFEKNKLVEGLIYSLEVIVFIFNLKSKLFLSFKENFAFYYKKVKITKNFVSLKK